MWHLTFILAAFVSMLALLMINEPAVAAPSPALAVECRARGGLPNFFTKLNAGQEARIAYLGGSITEAAGWRPLSLGWFRQQYPRATITEIHAAISGTGSDFGACRLERDVLRHKPDLLFVEFAVNDGGASAERIVRSMEGIVRQTWTKDARTDICFVYTLSEGELKNLQAGKFSRSASAQEAVAEHYAIPSIHLGMEVARLVKEGKVIFTGKKPVSEADKAALGDKVIFSDDGVHPFTDTGHPFYLAAIVRSMPALVGSSAVRRVPAPLAPDNWSEARQVPLSLVQRSAGWQRLDPATNALAKNVNHRMPELWKASEPGATLEFHFNGKAFGFAGLKGPDVGSFAVTADDEKPVVATFFDHYSTENRYRIKPWFYPRELSDGAHRVRIELLREAPDKAAIFQRHGIAKKDPEQFKGNNLYVGDVLIVGALFAGSPKP